MTVSPAMRSLTALEEVASGSHRTMGSRRSSIVVRAGHATDNIGGTLYLQSGSSTNGSSGMVSLSSGDADDSSGNVVIASGNVDARTSGSVNLETGNGAFAGSINIRAGESSESQKGAHVHILGGASQENGGDIVVKSGHGNVSSGRIDLSSAPGIQDSNSGNVRISTGETMSGLSGDIIISTGLSKSSSSGAVIIGSGHASEGAAGSVSISVGESGDESDRETPSSQSS